MQFCRRDTRNASKNAVIAAELKAPPNATDFQIETAENN